MSYAEYASSVKNVSNNYVRDQLYAFNFGAFDYLKGNEYNLLRNGCKKTLVVIRIGGRFISPTYFFILMYNHS